MTTKMSLTTLLAAAILAFGGVATAQPTSTPGAGCTATANAMRGGNLGSSPSDIGCTTAGAKNAAAPVAAPVAATAMPAAAPAAAPVTTTMTTSTAVAADNSGARTVRAPIRVARAPRADRN